MPRQRKTKVCLECGDALPSTGRSAPARRKLNLQRDGVIAPHLCSVQCRDFRAVKEALGEDQFLQNSFMTWRVRKGEFLRDTGTGVWFVADACTNPCVAGQVTTINITCRRYSGDVLRIHIRDDFKLITG